MHVTEQLQRLHGGDRDAMNNVIPMVYDELKKLARAHLRREVKASSMEATALVHEAFLKLANGRHPTYENRAHFYGIASRVMRQILVDIARAKAADKRAAAQEVPLAEVLDCTAKPDRSLLALEDALQALEKQDYQKARLIEMRYFGGMTAEESALALSMPVYLVRRELRLAQAYLRARMWADKAGLPAASSSETPSLQDVLTKCKL